MSINFKPTKIRGFNNLINNWGFIIIYLLNMN
jgi:hypothetical protein